MIDDVSDLQQEVTDKVGDKLDVILPVDIILQPIDLQWGLAHISRTNFIFLESNRHRSPFLSLFNTFVVGEVAAKEYGILGDVISNLVSIGASCWSYVLMAGLGINVDML